MEKLTSNILKNYYPFNRCGVSFRTRAFTLGEVRYFSAGDHIRDGNEKNKEFGLILEGEAISFETDVENTRYRLSLTPGCWFGLELLDPSEKPLSKINALSDVTVLAWNQDDMDFLCENSSAFERSLYRLKEGSEFQQASLIPQTDTTDPVLMVIRPHWILPVLKCAAVIGFLCVSLEMLSNVTGQNQASLTLMILCSLGAGWGLYTIIRRWLNDQWIITSHNLISFPPDSAKEPGVIPLSMLDQCDIESSLFGIGRLQLKTYGKGITSFWSENAADTGALLQSACCALPGGINIFRENPAATDEEDASDTKTLSLEYRAHWMLLIRLMLWPLIIFILLLFFLPRIGKTGYYGLILCFVFCWLVYRFIDWFNDRFYIEEDCVRNVRKKPLSKETIGITMLDNIQSVRFEKKGIPQLLFDYGTLYILAGKGELTFPYISNPKKVQKYVQDACARFKKSKAKEEELQRLNYIEKVIKTIRENNNNPGNN